MVFWSDKKNLLSYREENGSNENIHPIQSFVLFYCNFTKFCTLFSRTFRRLTANESIESVKERNAEVSEFSRLLMETVFIHGKRMYLEKKIKVFYHGVSAMVLFKSTFAQFCSPTSTTTALPVALNFGKRGIIIELKNTQSILLPFLDCSVISDFSNEEERLFFQGGYQSGFLSNTYLSFNSIRVIHSNHSYKVYVQSITFLLKVFNERLNHSRRHSEWVFDGLQKRHIRCLTALAADALQEKQNEDNDEDDGDDEKENANGISVVIPPYIRNLFRSVREQITCISMYLEDMSDDSSYRLKLFRGLFCDELDDADDGDELTRSRLAYIQIRFLF